MSKYLLEAGESACLCACVVKMGSLPAWVAVLQWMHSLDNSQPHGQPENMPEVTVISFGWVSVIVKSTSFCMGQSCTHFSLCIYSIYSFYPGTTVHRQMPSCFLYTWLSVYLHTIRFLKHKCRLTFMTLKSTSWPKLSFSLKNSCSG